MPVVGAPGTTTTTTPPTGTANSPTAMAAANAAAQAKSGNVAGFDQSIAQYLTDPGYTNQVLGDLAGAEAPTIAQAQLASAEALAQAGTSGAATNAGVARLTMTF